MTRIEQHRPDTNISTTMAEEPQHIAPFPSYGTLAIHAGQEPEQFPGNSVVAPISMSVTFKQEAPGVYKVGVFFRGDSDGSRSSSTPAAETQRAKRWRDSLQPSPTESMVRFI